MGIDYKNCQSASKYGFINEMKINFWLPAPKGIVASTRLLPVDNNLSSVVNGINKVDISRSHLS